MKKIIPILVLLLGFLGLAIYISYDQSKTDQTFQKTWTLENPEHQKIEIYGTEQPIELQIFQTTNKNTTVSITGKLSKSSVESIKDSELTDNMLYVPISKHGFRLLTTSAGKDHLTITVELGNQVLLDKIFLDSVSGEINVKVPQSFEGHYDITLNNGAHLKEVPHTNQTSQSIVKIDAYSDVRIVKGD